LVIRRRNPSHARCGAKPDDVIMAMAIIIGIRPLRTARPQTIVFFYIFEYATSGTRAYERTEIGGAVRFLDAAGIKHRQWIILVYPQQKKTFVIFECRIVMRSVFLDQPVFRDQRFRLTPHHDKLKIGDALDQPTQFWISLVQGAGLKIIAHAVAQGCRLADVNDFPILIPHKINPRLVGEGSQSCGNIFLGGLCAHEFTLPCFVVTAIIHGITSFSVDRAESCSRPHEDA
jgi:hypothetical protein